MDILALILVVNVHRRDAKKAAFERRLWRSNHDFLGVSRWWVATQLLERPGVDVCRFVGYVDIFSDMAVWSPLACNYSLRCPFTRKVRVEY